MKTETPTLSVSPRFSVRFAPIIVVAALMALCPLRARANTIALSFTPSGNLDAAGADETEGWAFTLSSSVLLTDLGVWDGPNGSNGSVGDGLLQSHMVTIWTSTGTQVLGAQGTVPSGTGATLTNGFRYVSIAPVLLPAGSYTIGAFFPAGGPDRWALDATTVTTAAGVTYNGSSAGFGNAFPPSTSDPNSYFGPNFQFTIPTSVPDSASTWTLLLLGVTATFGLKSFVCRSA
jgi:hypothetical protein